MITIDMPWPNRKLHPNGRPTRGELIRLKKQARTLGAGIALEHGLHKFRADSIRIQLTFHPKTANAFDTDNAVASMKSYLDGIADVLKIDDSRWEWEKPIKGQPEKGGRVSISITGHVDGQDDEGRPG